MLKNIIKICNIFSRKKYYLQSHNGIDIDQYPETNWNLVPFPNQKGKPFNNDNLATVNKSSFKHDDRFINALKVAESRWANNNSEKVRDISWRLHVMLWTISLALNEIDLENEIFVECGTGKGYMAAGICDYFKWTQEKPDFYLIDSFKTTMPESDGRQVDSGHKLFVYADGDEEIRKYFVNYNNIKILTGFIPDILKEIPDDKKIRFLHVDLNSANAEYAALINLKAKFVRGSIILFDDYGGFGGEKQAIMHEKFANEINRNLLILPTGQALIIF